MFVKILIVGDDCMSSAECLAMARKFRALKGEISALHGSVDACSTAIGENESTMEETVLSGRPLDDGKLTESKGELDGIHGNLSTMEAECDEKYDYWMQAYYAALAREHEAARSRRSR